MRSGRIKQTSETEFGHSSGRVWVRSEVTYWLGLNNPPAVISFWLKWALTVGVLNCDRPYSSWALKTSQSKTRNPEICQRKSFITQRDMMQWVVRAFKAVCGYRVVVLNAFNMSCFHEWAVNTVWSYPFTHAAHNRRSSFICVLASELSWINPTDVIRAMEY